MSAADTPRPAPDGASITDLYYLISFAPDTGIGLYEYLGVKRRIDLVPSPRTTSDPRKIADVEADADQVEAGIYLNSLEVLISFCLREYIKEKKHASYGMLFTERMARADCARALAFLNDPRLSAIPIAKAVLSFLEDVAEPHRVSSVVLQACGMGLQNVTRCLGTELSSIALSRPVLEHLRAEASNAEEIISRLRSQPETGGS